MVYASASAIQISTLAVAGAAVVASVIGIFLNHRFSRSSEHHTWQRDLRVRIYADCASAAGSYSDRLNDMALGQRSLEDLDGEYGASNLVMRRELRFKVAEVGTFGSTEVGTAALQMQRALLIADFRAIRQQENQADARTKAFAAVREFRAAVRKSLMISDD